MKKIFTKSWLKAACVAVLGLVSVNAWAQDPDYTFTFNAKETKTSDDGLVTVTNGISIYGGRPNVYYDNQFITFRSNDSERPIVKIQLTGTSGTNANLQSIDAVGYSIGSYDMNTFTWVGSAPVVQLGKIVGVGIDLYFSGVSVWLEESVDPSLTFSVGISEVEHGTISASPTTDVHYNDEVALSATPDAGYSLEAWDVTNNTTSGKVIVTDNTFKMPASDVTVSATFVKVYSLTLGSVDNGTIHVSKDNNIKEGEVITLAATPADGYVLDSWSVTNDETHASVPVVDDKFNMPNANVTVSASFVLIPQPGDPINIPVDGYSGISPLSGVEFFYSAYGSSDGINLYSTWGYLTLQSSTKRIVKVDMTCYYSNYSKIKSNAGVAATVYEKDNKGVMSVSSNVATWSGAENSLAFYSSDDMQVYELVVYLEADPAPTSEDITISAAGYATYFNADNAVELPAGLSAYTVAVAPAIDFSSLELVYDETYKAGDVVPAGEPVVLKGDAGDYVLNFTTTSATPLKDEDYNNLEGSNVEGTTTIPALYEGVYTEDDFYFYGLSLNAAGDLDSVGFYWMNGTGSAFTTGAHKAYLCIPQYYIDMIYPAGSNAVRGFSFKDMENGISTGIKNIEAKSNAASFNLNGLRVANDAKGLVIRGGKKFINK